MLTLQLTIEGDRELFERTANRLADMTPFLRQVGVLALSSAVRRLPEVLNTEGVRSGRLEASLRMAETGDADGVFELDANSVEVGSNLPYAAQVHFGGTIVPKPGHKALAIPVDDVLQRRGIGPREYQGKLRFQPYIGAKANVCGLFIDEETGELKYVLVYWVTQQARPFLYWGDEDLAAIDEDLWPKFIGA